MKNQFIPYGKRSKKAQKVADAAKRGTWGLVKPVTRVKPSGKTYNRQAFKRGVA